MITEIIMPKLGQTMEEGTIVQWLVKEGDVVEKGDVLFQLESDKAVLEAEAPARGQLRKVFYPNGTKLPVLTVVGLIAAADDDIGAYTPPAPAAGEPPPAALEAAREAAPTRPEGADLCLAPGAPAGAGERHRPGPGRRPD